MRTNRAWTGIFGTRKRRHGLTNGETTPGGGASGGAEIPVSQNGYSGTTESTGERLHVLSPEVLTPVTAMECPMDLMAYWVTEVELREFMIWLRGLPHLDPELTMPEVKEAVAESAHEHGIHIWCSPTCGAYPVKGHEYTP